MTVYIITNQPTNQLTPRRTDLLEKMTVMQPVKKSHSSFFITIKRRKGGEIKKSITKFSWIFNSKTSYELRND
jgi:hypothetical protein